MYRYKNKEELENCYRKLINKFIYIYKLNEPRIRHNNIKKYSEQSTKKCC